MRDDHERSVARRRILQSLGTGATMMALAGCSGTQSEGDTTTSPKPGGSGGGEGDSTTATNKKDVPRGGTLQVAGAGDPENLDPHTTTINVAQQVLDNVVENLFELDDKLNIKPVLASDHSVSDDNTTYEITLKEGVKFHDESEFTSADVKYSINRILDPELGSPRKANFEMVDSIETPNKYTVRFLLLKPFAPFMIGLAESAAMVPKGSGDNRNLKQNPIGTGPFKLKKWTTDDSVVLSKFQQYHAEGQPYLNEINFSIIPEAATRLTQLQSSSANVMFGVPFQKASPIKKGSNTTLQTSPSLWKQSFWFNTDQKPFDDPKVRRAISYAINQKQLVMGVLFGQGQPAYSPAVPASAWRERLELGKPHKFNKQKARSLLKEAGVKPSSISATIKASRTPGPTYADTATLIQSNLTQLGMNVDIQIMDFSTWLQEVWTDKNFQLSVGSWSGRIDPDGWYYRQYHSEGPWNRFNYANEKVDSLLEKGRTTTDIQKRADIYSQVDQIVSQEVPMTYLYFKQQMTGLGKNVGGYNLSPAHQAEFESTYLKG